MKTGEQTTIKFEAETYARTYQEILAAVVEVLESENGEIYRSQLVAWTKTKK